MITEIERPDEVANRWLREHIETKLGAGYVRAWLYREKGECGGILLDIPPADVVAVVKVVVPTAHRGKSVGTAVMRFAETIGHESGKSKIIVHPRALDDETDEALLRSWYARLGYVAVSPDTLEKSLPLSGPAHAQPQLNIDQSLGVRWPLSLNR